MKDGLVMVGEVKELLDLDFKYIFIGIVVILITVKSLWTLLEWLFVEKLGLQTRKQRQLQQDRARLDAVITLAEKTATNLNKLQSRHTEDEEEFRNNLNNYMEESRKDREALHTEMEEYRQNRIDDRKQSITIQKELKDSINTIAKRQDDRDEKIKELTDIIVDKQISDYRWEIIGLADDISNGKKVSKDASRHAISTYAKYENIIEKYGLTNGEVEVSMEVITETLRELLKDSAES